MATWLYLDTADDRDVYAAQIVGEENTPLTFSDGGYLELDDDDLAEELARRKSHIHFAASHPDAEPPTESGAGDGGPDEGESVGETPDSVADAPLDPRDYTIAELSDELDGRDFDDDQLDALAQAERDTQDREGALDTIDDHRTGNGAE